MAEPPSSFDVNGDNPCINLTCETSNSSCSYTCIYSTEPFLFPPPPPQPPISAVTRVAPFLIATVCILGISFLLLTTCTIILRYRFSRRRRRSSSTASASPSVSDGGDAAGDGGGVDHPIWHIATVGLQQSVIDSITAFKYRKLDGGALTNGVDCSVCLTEFEDGDDVRLLPKCSHAFHLPCIDTWLRSHKNCPLCRAPVVNESCRVSNLGNSNSLNDIEEQREMYSSDDDDDDDGDRGPVSLEEGIGGESSHHQSERRDDFRHFSIEGIRIAEILKKNRDLRIHSDLGENYRFRGGEEDGVEPIRRSISFNSMAVSAIARAMGNVVSVGNEGCSSNALAVVDEKKVADGKGNKRGSSMSGLLMKSSSIGRSLQKGPVSMKRSISSSGKLFSFRRTKSQASILPL